MIALTAMSLGYVVGGVIFIESVFSWPGIGQVTYDALLNRDLPVLQGVFLLSSAAVILMNLLADRDHHGPRPARARPLMAVSSETVARLLGAERNPLVRWLAATMRGGARDRPPPDRARSA